MAKSPRRGYLLRVTTPTTVGVKLARERIIGALDATPPRLDLAALGVATLFDPELDLEGCLVALDGYADEVREELRRTGAWENNGALLPRLEALRRVLGERAGFRGDDKQYDAPDNSYLHRVLERRTGLPITLSVIYVEVARRAGIPLFGVGFPGHFLVAARNDANTLVIDPFKGGAVLTTEGCRELLLRVAPQLKFEDKMLAAAPPELITVRMLTNLRRTFLERKMDEQALTVVDMLLLLVPDHPGELRTRATLLCSLGAYHAALRDVERCLLISPDAPDRQVLEMTARELRQRASLLN